jgi:hypothetical protein
MTLKSICDAPWEYDPKPEDAPKPSLRAYQDYLRNLCVANPSLSTFSSVVAKPQARTFECCATAVEFRAGGTSDIRSITNISCLRSEFSRATNNDMKRSIENLGSAVQGRILIIEDLTVDVITILGTELDIDPLFLATHLHTVHRTGMRHQTPDDATLPSRLHQSDYINISYHQPVTCTDVYPAGARFMTDTAVNRKLVFLRATNIGLAQHRTSIIKIRQEDNFWLGIFIWSQYQLC